MWFHRLLELGFDVLDALRLAKARMLASRWVWMQANRDARAFRAHHRI
jgi:hypothetical protein